MLSYAFLPPSFPTPSTSSTSPTSSASSSKLAPKAPTSKSKRARPCEACKVRRVGCKRLMELKDSCDWCHERGVRCITDTTPCTPRSLRFDIAPNDADYVTVHEDTRKGKRIEQAKEAFGIVGATPPQLSRTENEMASQEMTLSLGYHLVEVYVEGGYFKRDTPHFILPCANWRLFKRKFEEAGRDPMKLGPCGQVVAYIVFANAARVSQHSAIAGSSSTSPAEIFLNATPTPNIPTNSSRNSAYQVLINKAIKLCDENAIWRTEAPDSQVAMVVMFLMYYLVCDGDLSKKEAQHYSKSAMELLRLTYEESEEERRKNIGEFDSFAWVTLILDAYSSVETGKPPKMTTTDILSYIGVFPPFLQPPTTSKFIIIPTSSGAGERFWQPWLGAIMFVVQLARDVGDWRRGVGVGGTVKVQEFWKRLKEVEEWGKISTRVREGLAGYLWNFCELYTGMIWACAVTLHSIIRDHLGVLLALSDPTLLPSPTSSSPDDGDNSFSELVVLSAIAEQNARESVTEFIHWTKNERGVYILSVITGTIFSISRLIIFAKDFLNHLSSSEEKEKVNGRSFLEKRSGLEFLYRLLVKTHQAWSDKALEETIIVIFTELLRFDGNVSLDPHPDPEWKMLRDRVGDGDEVTKKRSRIMLEWAMMDCIEFLE